MNVTVVLHLSATSSNELEQRRGPYRFAQIAKDWDVLPEMHRILEGEGRSRVHGADFPRD